jgi:phosphatidylglycerol lysyltransferase
MWRARIRRALGVAASLVVVAAAAWAVREAMREYHYEDLRAAIASLPPPSIALSLLLSAGSYAALTCYDVLAGRYVGSRLGWARTALTSFISYSVGHNVGFGNLAGSSIRYRLYSAWGMSAADIARVIVFCTAGFWVGYFSLASIVFVSAPLALPPALMLPAGADTRALGLVLGAPVIALLAWSAVRRTPLQVRGMELALPSTGIVAAQVVAGIVDWTCAGSALYAVMPASLSVGWAPFLGLYLLATLAGLISHVPGGLGVVESAMLLLLADKGASSASILASVLVFRVCYYLVPLGTGSILLLWHEARRHRAAIRGALAPAVQGVTSIAAPLLAVGCFAGGVALLVSGSGPPIASRFRTLGELLPLTVIETAHFTASIAGTLLLLVAHSLQRRLDAAYRLGTWVLGAGAVSGLLAGFHVELTIFLLVLLGALQLGRDHFYRKAALLNEPLTGPWVGAVLAAAVTAIALGFVAFESVHYRRELWWEFALRAHAPRWMRASVGMSVVLLVYGALRLLRPARVEPEPPTSSDMDDARRVIASSPTTGGNLALLGDKVLLFNAERTAFLMYGVNGRSWVTMGDPVGPEDEWSDLLWTFQGLADDVDARCVFYEIGSRRLDLYLDLGMSLFKLGEEARVDLATYTLDARGKDAAEFRRVRRNLEREGYAFRVMPVDETRARIAELRRISDEWLGEKNVGEKGFSLGWFDEDYVAGAPCAVVEKDGKACAFANLWLGGGREELTVDLMRYTQDSPNGLMDYLFTSLMLWGREQGYQWFSLGMAPLAGLNEYAPGSLWSAAGRLVYRYGEHFYNFEGLRRYKNKFAPVWTPRYLACATAWQLPQALADVTVLVSGGLRRAISR